MGLWVLSMETLALVLSSALLALIIGIPTGILSAKNDVLYHLVKPSLDFMQTRITSYNVCYTKLLRLTWASTSSERDWGGITQAESPEWTPASSMCSMIAPMRTSFWSHTVV